MKLRRFGRGLLVLALFAGLVFALLWFQGIVLRKDYRPLEPAGARAPIALRSARVERRSLPRVHEIPGFVEADEPISVSARVLASLLELGPREGEAVAAGQQLALLDDRDARARLAQAQASLEAARAAAAQAAAAFARAERLRGVQALTQQDWEAAQAAEAGARAQQQRAEQGVEEARAALSWYRIEAPCAGRVLERRAEPGQLALPGQPLLVLYTEQALRLRVDVPEQQAALVPLGAPLRVSFDAVGERAARVARVLPPADPASGTIALQLVADSWEGLRPGSLGRLWLEVGQREALLVPSRAIERIGQIERVQLLRDGRALPAVVRSGRAHGEQVELLSGLAEGEEVLLR